MLSHAEEVDFQAGLHFKRVLMYKYGHLSLSTALYLMLRRYCALCFLYILLVPVLEPNLDMAASAKPKGMSEEQIEFVKSEEKFKPMPYADGKDGGQSVGYGFRMKMWPEKAKDLQLPITEGKADELLRAVDNWNAKYLAKKYGEEAWDKLHTKQRDALQSTAYNAGAPSVWKKIGTSLKENNFEEVANQLEGHATSGNLGDRKVDLSTRRGREADLFRAGTRENRSLN